MLASLSTASATVTTNNNNAALNSGSNHHPRHSHHHRSQNGKFHNALLLLAAAATMVTLASIFGPTMYLLEQQQKQQEQRDAVAVAAAAAARQVAQQQQQQQQPQQPVPAAGGAVAQQQEDPKDDDGVAIKHEDPKDDGGADVVEVDDLLHEDLFQATIRNCMDAADGSKCKRFVPEPQHAKERKVQRIAVVAPPGDLSSSLLNRVEQIVMQHNRLQHKVDLDMEVVSTSHVPPYGYGKTHGYTAMVRLVPQPLALQITDALISLLQPGESMQDSLTLLDMQMATRQILRFHCRLSHVAAHTALYSVPFFDLLTDPSSVQERMHVFLAPNDKLVKEQDRRELEQTQQKKLPDRDKKNDGEDAKDDVDDKNFNMMNAMDDALQFTADDDQGGLFDAQEAYGTQLFSTIQRREQVNVAALLDQVLMEELTLTKNMTVWPCPSFWTAGSSTNDVSELPPLTVLARRLAEALSPICNTTLDPFSSCFVKRDLCEARGDGPC